MPRGRPSNPHANSKHPLYSTWSNMRTRCNNSRAPKYKNWGGRGIRVCERWDDFKLFAADMGPKPSPAHQIERVDNDGDYEPFNCIWALPVQQRQNQRRVIHREPKPPKVTGWRGSVSKYERLTR